MPSPDTESPLHRARTKIVATIGPACRGPEKLAGLLRAGADVFRINTAHGSREERETILKEIREAEKLVGTPVGVLLDLAGPKIRLGELKVDPLPCEMHAVFRFIRGTISQAPDELTSNYPPLIDELDVGDPVMLADGTVSMIVVNKTTDEVHCKVVGAGQLRSRQGINLPGTKLSVPSLTDADLSNVTWAAQHQVDFVSLSFVRSAEEIRQLKILLRGNGSQAFVIAKIEKREALENLTEIVAATDGVMVARGDLGVEIDFAEIAVTQVRKRVL
jgi:pyruvate kinase